MSKSTPATADAAEPELIWVDPRTLKIAANVRTDIDLPDTFVNSIRKHGVMQAITVYRDDDGELAVYMGQRRTLGAVKAKRPKIPALLVANPADVGERIVKQVRENDDRDAITNRDRVNAYEELVAFGLSAEVIAEQMSAAQEDVTAALRVARSQRARKVITQHPGIDLTHSAAMLEFEDDEAAVETLTEAALNGGFDHAVQKLRDDRRRAAAKQELTDQLTAAKVKIVSPPGWDHPKIRPLGELKTADGAKITEADHASCPGHAAFLDERWSGRDGKAWTVIYACAEYKTYGHYKREDTRKRASDMTAAVMSTPFGRQKAVRVSATSH